MPVMKCDNPNCNHLYQDKKYGSKMRIFNKTPNKSNKGDFRCTVCNTDKTSSASAVADIKKKKS